MSLALLIGFVVLHVLSVIEEGKVLHNQTRGLKEKEEGQSSS